MDGQRSEAVVSDGHSSDPLAGLEELPVTLSRADAARHAGCSTRHLDRAIARGEVLTLSHGRRRVVLRDSFRRWLEMGLGK